MKKSVIIISSLLLLVTTLSVKAQEMTQKEKIKDYKQSAQSARKALKVDNTQTWINANLAHALLFQGRFSKAEKIYKDLSQPAKDNNTYSKSLLEDLDELEKAGVIPEKRKTDVEKIKKMLGE